MILYTLERPFMRKTYELIDRHVSDESAYLPVGPAAQGCSESIRELEPPAYDVETIDRTIRESQPEVIVRNHRNRLGEYTFDAEYPLVHIRHGASVGRGEIANTVGPEMQAVLDVALAPGERWARRYREAFPDSVRVSTVGIPEADDLVDAPTPHSRSVLYAPTNHKFGQGCYLKTAEAILELFAHTDYELRFRPHPLDRRAEPAKSVTERCRQQIQEIPNIVFDQNSLPSTSLRAADLLISDYSGLVTEWLHTGRPLIQLTDLATTERTVPEIGYTTSITDLELGTIDTLYRHGYPEAVDRRHERFLEAQGIPMDGRAGKRAAQEVRQCTR